MYLFEMVILVFLYLDEYNQNNHEIKISNRKI